MIKPKKGELGARLRLDDLTDEQGDVRLAVYAVDNAGKPLATAEVDDDGTFAIDRKAVEAAHRIVVVAADGDPADRAASVAFRAHRFLDQVDLGEIALGPRDWSRLFSIRRCADATIRACRPTWPVIRPLLLDRVARFGSPVLESPIIGPPIIFPPWRCSAICEGLVEVYRRTCCCRPPIFDPPVRIPPDFPWEPPIPTPDPFPDPFPGPFPDPVPGPDPVPFDVLDTVVTEGALDVARTEQLDRLSLARLHGPARHAFLVARPWLWCTCGAGTKVGQGFVGEGGRIHVCWREPLRFLPANCRDQYAFVVKQNIGGNTVTIYNGPAAGQWFDASDDDVDLTSYHPFAVTCRDNDFPADPGGAYVVLQDIGSTESHRLRTPLQDSANSVTALGHDSGLLDVGGTDYALGATLNLRYHFSESMQAIGARYYRVQVAPADLAGDPNGPWQTVPAPAWDTWRSSGGTIERGSHALGPNVVGGQPDLFHIPFETGAPLGAGEEWQDGQFHALLDTTQRPAGRYLLRIEVFDAAGNQMTPGADPFSFRRWINPTDTLPVPFGALTHALRTDNRPVVGDIVDVTGPGAGAGDCKFFVGPPFANVNVQLRAFHPQPGTPSFMLSWHLNVRRGINGGNAVVPITSTAEVGEGGLPHTASFTIADLLDGEPKCSFTANLNVYARIHNGSGRITAYDRHDQASFAVESVGFFPPFP